MEKTQNTMNPAVIGIIAVVIIGVLAVGAFSMQNGMKSDEKNTISTVTPSPVISQMDEKKDSAKDMSYKDGMYDVVGMYTSPAGEEELGVSVTLKEGVITEVDVEVKATKPISKKMQEDFAANYKTQVVGKSLDEVKLGKISGSSLTPKGFNDALEKVKKESSS